METPLLIGLSARIYTPGSAGVELPGVFTKTLHFLGGMGTFLGPFIGAAVFLYLEDVVTNVTRYWMGVVGIVFMIFVLFFPKGVWGTALDWVARWQRKLKSGGV